MYYVYIIQNKSKDQIYVGSTKDLRKRIKTHNKGKEISTKRYLPWRLVYYEAFMEEKLARNRESKLKYNGNAMKELKKRIGLGLPSTSLSIAKTGAGFTIVEILVVLGVMAILISSILVLINPQAQLEKSRDARRKSDLKQIQAALELYRADIGTYPDDTSTDGSANAVQNCGVSLSDKCPADAVYIQSVPKDPKGTDYYYDLQTNGGYRLFSCAENRNDAEASCACSDTSAACSTNPNPCVGSGIPAVLSCSPARYFRVDNP